MKITSFFYLLLVVGLSSCGKDKVETPEESTMTTNISKAWRLISLKYNGVEEFVGVPACEADDLLEIKTDKTFLLTEGATKCSPSAPQIQGQSTWLFHANETKIQFLLDDAPIYDIVKLTNDTLKLKGLIDDNDLQELVLVNK